MHSIQYAHIYADQLAHVDEMLDARAAPAADAVAERAAGRAVTDIHDFRAEHFELTDYDPHPAINQIPVLT